MNRTGIAVYPQLTCRITRCIERPAPMHDPRSSFCSLAAALLATLALVSRSHAQMGRPQGPQVTSPEVATTRATVEMFNKHQFNVLYRETDGARVAHVLQRAAGAGALTVGEADEFGGDDLGRAVAADVVPEEEAHRRQVGLEEGLLPHHGGRLPEDTADAAGGATDASGAVVDATRAAADASGMLQVQVPVALAGISQKWTCRDPTRVERSGFQSPRSKAWETRRLPGFISLRNLGRSRMFTWVKR